MVEENKRMKTVVGACKLNAIDPGTQCSIPVLAMYPTQSVAKPTQFGPFSIDLAMDAPVGADNIPLVVISHGTGSSHLVFRTLAHFLAKNNTIVALLEHPGDNLFDNSLQYTYENVENRPRHLSTIIDAIYAHERFRSHAQQNKVAVIGHSVGGYTALAAAGGKPHTGFLVEFCQNSREQKIAPWITLIRNNQWPSCAANVTTDHRINAIVLLAPDVSLFMQPDALNDIKIPTLLMVAEHDLWPEKIIDILSKRLKSECRLETRLIENAGHYSFISPFPEAMQAKVGEAAIDPPGFNRLEFQQQLEIDILNFLRNVNK